MEMKLAHSPMRRQKAREETFYKQVWPHIDFASLHPRRLAAAGFYFDPAADGKDKCICFACGLQLVNWDPNDNPFGEHLKHSESSAESERCIYVHFVKKLNPVLLGVGPTRKNTMEEDGLMEMEVGGRDKQTVAGLKESFNIKRDFMKCLLISTMLKPST